MASNDLLVTTKITNHPWAPQLLQRTAPYISCHREVQHLLKGPGSFGVPTPPHRVFLQISASCPAPLSIPWCFNIPSLSVVILGKIPVAFVFVLTHCRNIDKHAHTHAHSCRLPLAYSWVLFWQTARMSKWTYAGTGWLRWLLGLRMRLRCVWGWDYCTAIPYSTFPTVHCKLGSILLLAVQLLEMYFYAHILFFFIYYSEFWPTNLIAQEASYECIYQSIMIIPSISKMDIGRSESKAKVHMCSVLFDLFWSVSDVTFFWAAEPKKIFSEYDSLCPVSITHIHFCLPVCVCKWVYSLFSLVVLPLSF